MDISNLAKKLDLADNNLLLRKAAELRRLIDVHLDSSIIGVGEICKAVICLEIAASRYVLGFHQILSLLGDFLQYSEFDSDSVFRLQVIFDRQAAVKLSGMSERAYSRSFNTLQNGVGFKIKLNVKELAIQFGCVRIITTVQKGLSAYKERFLASLPVSRRANADFTRPVFTAASFFLCAKKHKLKVDKNRLIEVCGTSESEFSCVLTSMMDLCFDFFGVSKEKKDPKELKAKRGLLEALPKKRRRDDSSDDEPSCYKRQKKMEETKSEDCDSTLVAEPQA